MIDTDDEGGYLPQLWELCRRRLAGLPDITDTQLGFARMVWHAGVRDTFETLRDSMDSGGLSDCPMRRMVGEVADEAEAVIATLAVIGIARMEVSDE